MKKHLRLIIATLCVGMFLFAGFILAVNLYVQSVGVQNRVRTTLSETLGMPVGMFRATFSPWGGFRLDQIRVASDLPAAQEDFLKADCLEVRCEFIPLLKGRIVLKRIALDAPQVTFQQNVLGQYRLPSHGGKIVVPVPPTTPITPDPTLLPEALHTPLTTPKASPSTQIVELKPPPSQCDLDIRKLLLRDGVFRFLAKDGSELLRFEGLRCSLNAQAAPNTFAGVLEIKKAVLMNRWEISNLEASIYLENQKLRLEKINGNLAEGRIEGRLEADLAAQGQPYTVSLQLSNAQLAQFFPKDSDYANELSGLVRVRLEFAGFATEEKQNKGNLEIKILRGKVSELPMFRTLNELVQSKEFGQFSVKRANFNFEINGTQVQIVRSYIRSEQLEIKFAGPLGEGQKLDLQAHLWLSEELFKKLPTEARENFVKNDEAQKQVLDFSINGTVFAPKTNFLNRLIGEKLQKKFKRILGNDDETEPTEATPTPSPKKMRVVAGLAGGIPLEIPKHDLRPTMDKVKGAIFSSLGEAVVGAKVLDLYAGSGALGIEALSRGAAQAIMVEMELKALNVIAANLQKTRLEATVYREEVSHFLKRNTATFDLIFADPPYAKKKGDIDFCDQLWHSADLARALAPDGFFILERAPGKPLPETSLFRLIRQKRYGASEVLLLAHKDANP